MLKQFQNQKGAIFGLDARIALAIFSGLTIIAGVTLSSKIGDITGSALVDETRKIGLAIEGMQVDLKQDIFKVLDDPSETNAFESLYNPELLNPGKARARWLGPYVDFRENQHPSYGTLSIYKRGEIYSEVCRAGQICYLWLVMNKVPNATLEYANRAYDGRDESLPEKSGRIQFQTAEQPDHSVMWYRIGRAL